MPKGAGCRLSAAPADFGNGIWSSSTGKCALEGDYLACSLCETVMKYIFGGAGRKAFAQSGRPSFQLRGKNHMIRCVACTKLASTFVTTGMIAMVMIVPQAAGADVNFTFQDRSA